MTYSVLIIDDHELFSAALRIALRGEGIDADHIVPNRAESVLSRAAEGPAGLAVLDLDLGSTEEGKPLHGSTLVSGLRRAGWQVLVVSGSSNEAGTAAAVAEGAIGVVPKSSSFETLLRTVLRAASGQAVMDEAERRRWRDLHRGHQEAERDLSRRIDKLSRREREVLELLADGYRAAAIADHFVVSLTTVRTQIRAVLAKLEVSSQLEAVALVGRRPGGGRK